MITMPVDLPEWENSNVKLKYLSSGRTSFIAVVNCGGQNATPAAFLEMFSSRGRSFSRGGVEPPQPLRQIEHSKPMVRAWSVSLKRGSGGSAEPPAGSRDRAPGQEVWGGQTWWLPPVLHRLPASQVLGVNLGEIWMLWNCLAVFIFVWHNNSFTAVQLLIVVYIGFL